MRIMRKLLLLGALVLGCTTVSSAGTYYISTSGSDSNNGTATGTPWLHAPGMVNCTANCAGHTPVADDVFIFRGCDSWKNSGSPASLPWSWGWSGTSGHVISIGGFDKTWSNGACSNTGLVTTNGAIVTLPSKGESTAGTSSAPFITGTAWNGGSITINGGSYTIASVDSPYQLTLTASAGVHTTPVAYSNALWGKPKLDMEGVSSPTYYWFSGDGSTNIYMDQWELKGAKMDVGHSNAGRFNLSSIIVGGVNGNKFTNFYIHGWTHYTFSASNPNDEGFTMMYMGSCGSADPADCGNEELGWIVIDGSDSVDTSSWNGTGSQDCSVGGVRWGSVGNGLTSFYYPDGVCVSASGIRLGGYNIHDSRIKYVQNGVVTNNTALFYNNILERIYNMWDENDIPYHDNGFEMNGHPSASTKIYNNIFRYITADVTFWNNPNGTDYFFNNVMYATNSQEMDQPGAGQGGQGGTMLVYNNTFAVSEDPMGLSGLTTFINNHWITSTGASAAAAGTTETFKVNQTPAAAATKGYTAANAYAPTISNGSTYGIGSNLTASCAAAGAALCSDTTLGGSRTPPVRKVSGAWDIGAYSYGGPFGPPPTGGLLMSTVVPPGVVATPYTATLVATGGSPPYAWTGSLFPPGLALSASGVLSGTPTVSGTFNSSFNVRDSSQPNLTAAMSTQLVVVMAPPPPPPPPAGTVGPPGPVGPQGAQGLQGVQGVQGLQGIAGAVGKTPTIMTCIRSSSSSLKYTCTVTGWK